MACTGCDAHFSDRLDVPDWLYDSIYSNAKDITGYNRYDRYRKEILTSPSALDYLAEAEPAYWFVRDYLTRLSLATSDARIVELGCGNGYLTYALRQQGFQCVGVDVSEIAVAQAREAFGHPEWFMTTEEIHAAGELCDLVVSLELIEHVPDPREFVSAALFMLRPEGSLLLTTPNRDASPKEAIWASDVPPVHLYWLGRSGVRALAAASGAEARFLDWKPGPASIMPTDAPQSLRPPTFTADGQLSSYAKSRRRWATRGYARLAKLLRSMSDRLDPPLPGYPSHGRIRPDECETLGVEIKRLGGFDGSETSPTTETQAPCRPN